MGISLFSYGSSAVKREIENEEKDSTHPSL
jgi:hypothetical protein